MPHQSGRCRGSRSKLTELLQEFLVFGHVFLRLGNLNIGFVITFNATREQSYFCPAVHFRQLTSASAARQNLKNIRFSH
jgi:hypothetical protein